MRCQVARLSRASCSLRVERGTQPLQPHEARLCMLVRGEVVLCFKVMCRMSRCVEDSGNEPSFESEGSNCAGVVSGKSRVVGAMDMSILVS